MALKHYGGSTPTQATSWICPSCNTENTVPFKAGCQACGAGNDAKKVPQGPAATAEAVAILQDGGSLLGGPVLNAAHAWMTERDFPLTQITPWANSEQMREAFMAGVAWAQTQGPQPAQPIYPDRSGEEPPEAPATTLILWTDDGKNTDHVDTPTLTTILAALAFYRDNHLGYGPIPGQLDARQVTDLITRLTPQEGQG